jgi:putative alpha-1,2-mannosidase
LGFYPVCPGSNQYVIGTPYFKSVTLHYENGRTLTISAPNNSDANRYIESLDINGTASTRNYFTHSELNEGGKIMFRMSGEPNKLRGVLKTDAPYSFSSEKVK